MLSLTNSLPSMSHFRMQQAEEAQGEKTYLRFILM